MRTSYAPFEVADYLDSEAAITEYLSAAAEDPNPNVFLAAIGDVAKARGIAEISRKSGLGRESLYKTLKAGSHPRFETIQAVLHALGVKLTVIAQKPEAVSRALAHPSPSGNLVTDTNHE